jgi:hypothetical protein
LSEPANVKEAVVEEVDEPSAGPPVMFVSGGRVSGAVRFARLPSLRRSHPKSRSERSATTTPR